MAPGRKIWPPLIVAPLCLLLLVAAHPIYACPSTSLTSIDLAANIHTIYGPKNHSQGPAENSATYTCPPNNTAAEFSRPSKSQLPRQNTTILPRALPPAPPAILTGALGFICVTFIKDRRFWVGIMTTLIWAGHNDANTLVRLSQHRYFIHRPAAFRRYRTEPRRSLYPLPLHRKHVHQYRPDTTASSHPVAVPPRYIDNPPIHFPAAISGKISCSLRPLFLQISPRAPPATI